MKALNWGSALFDWTVQVRQNGPWDHKPKIRKLFHPVVSNGEQVWHHLNGVLYFYDIWSNIHYGYVGSACGFTASELLNGAGLEQIGSDLLRFKRPSTSFGVTGMKRFDDASDQAAIKIGIGFHPEPVNYQMLKNAVVNNAHLSKKRIRRINDELQWWGNTRLALQRGK